jgi:septum formation protein
MSRFILASGSSSRRQILARAGVNFLAQSSDIDETPIKEEALRLGLDVAATAFRLAEAKALDVAKAHSGALILGADQMLDCLGQRFDKPVDIADVRAQLLLLRGQKHRLTSALVMAKDKEIIWRYVEEAWLTMRDFSENFLDDYLESQGNEVTSTVGGYRIEEKGIQLFAAIEGEHTTILGLPLLPLLHFLRQQGIILT